LHQRRGLAEHFFWSARLLLPPGSDWNAARMRSEASYRWAPWARGLLKLPWYCSSCGVAPGGLHHPGCPVEECPRCRAQACTCGCVRRAVDPALGRNFYAEYGLTLNDLITVIERDGGHQLDRLRSPIDTASDEHVFFVPALDQNEPYTDEVDVLHSGQISRVRYVSERTVHCLGTDRRDLLLVNGGASGRGRKLVAELLIARGTTLLGYRGGHAFATELDRTSHVRVKKGDWLSFKSVPRDTGLRMPKGRLEIVIE
jgi:hypothetical protein